MGIPQVYIIPELKPKEENIMGILSGTQWLIYSDREKNTTYLGADGADPTGTMGFLEPAYVTNIKGDWLHISSDPTPGLDGILSKSAVDRGWIAKQSVLLWKSSLRDKLGKATQSVQLFTLRQDELFGFTGNGDKKHQGISIYHDPFFKNKTNLLTEPLELYFVYKEENNALLIGKETRIPVNSDPNEVILGWIAKDYGYILDTRIWISLNHSPLAQKEFETKGIMPTILADRQQAIDFMQTTSINKNYIILQLPIANSGTDWHCFPLVSESEGIYKVTLIEDEIKAGYCPNTIRGVENPLFTKVTLISISELNRVVSNMHELLDAAVEPINRELLTSTLLKLYKRDAYELNDETVFALTIKDVMDNLFWIINDDMLWFKNPFSKLNDETHIPDNEILILLKKIMGSEVELNKLVNNTKLELPVSFVSNNTRYVWVDITKFP